MVIIDTYVAVTLLALVSVASLAGLVLVGVALGRLAVTRHRRRVARQESLPSYRRHVAIGH